MLPFDEPAPVHAHRARARRTDPLTSQRAADRVQRRLASVAARVAQLLRFPQTHHELIDAYRALYGLTAESTIRTRVSELARDRRVTAISERDGCIVWMLTDVGKSWLESLAS